MGTIILLQFANLIKFLVSSKMNNQMDTSLERVTMVNVLMVWAWKFVHTISRWWQLRYFLCKNPFQLGETIQFDEHIFQMGWFNHQPDFSLRIFLEISHSFQIFHVKRGVFEKQPSDDRKPSGTDETKSNSTKPLGMCKKQSRKKKKAGWLVGR